MIRPRTLQLLFVASANFNIQSVCIVVISFSTLVPPAARILSTLVTFSEKCCFLSVLVFQSQKRHKLRVAGGVPCSNANISLNAHDSVLVDKRMSLAYQVHYCIPRSFCELDNQNWCFHLFWWRLGTRKIMPLEKETSDQQSFHRTSGANDGRKPIERGAKTLQKTVTEMENGNEERQKG